MKGSFPDAVASVLSKTPPTGGLARWHAATPQSSRSRQPQDSCRLYLASGPRRRTRGRGTSPGSFDPEAVAFPPLRGLQTGLLVQRNFELRGLLD